MEQDQHRQNPQKGDVRGRRKTEQKTFSRRVFIGIFVGKNPNSKSG
jgi:hypothetical protein